MKKDRLQWMVVDRWGHLYTASNASTKKAAMERHVSDLGSEWWMHHRAGDRLVRVSISVIKTLP